MRIHQNFTYQTSTERTLNIKLIYIFRNYAMICTTCSMYKINDETQNIKKDRDLDLYIFRPIKEIEKQSQIFIHIFN